MIQNLSRSTAFESWTGRLLIGCDLLLTIVLLKYSLLDNKISGVLLNSMSGVYQTVMLAGATLTILLVLITLFFSLHFFDDHKLTVLNRILFIVSAIVFGIVVFSADIWPGTDSYILLDQAKEMAQTGIKIRSDSVYYGTYFNRYSNNYFMTILFAFVYRGLYFLGLQDSYRPFYILNAACLYFSHVLVWKTVKTYGSNHTATGVLILLTLNPVFYIMAFWVYSATLSVPFLIGIVYLGLAFYHSDDIKKNSFRMGLLGLLAAISYFLRPTSLIPLIALICLGILKSITAPNTVRKCASGSVPFILSLLIFSSIIAKVNNYSFGEISGQTFPMTHWVMMSSHGDGTVNDSDLDYTASFATKEEKTAANLAMIKDNYKNLGWKGTIKLWLHKACVTFADGETQCKIRLASDMNPGEMQKWISGRYYDLFALYCNGFRAAVLLLMLFRFAYAFIKKSWSALMLLNSLTFLGGILFYCIWEVKSSYSIPFLPVMLMLAVPEQGIAIPFQLFTRKNALRNIALVGCGIFTVCWICGGAKLYKKINETDYTIKESSLRSTATWYEYSPMLTQDGTSMDQMLPLKNRVNTIELYAFIPETEKNENVKYQVELLNADENFLGSAIYTSKDFSDTPHALKFTFDPVEVDENEQYVLRITKISGGDASARFRYSPCISGGCYNGRLIIDGTAEGQNLFIIAYSQTRGAYMSSARFAAWFGLSSLLVALVWICLFDNIRKEEKRVNRDANY